jgi:hypothetical protein
VAQSEDRAPLAEAAWKAAADVTDWVWLATQRDGTTDAEFLELLHEQPLGKAAALVYGAPAPAPASGIGRRASDEVLAMLEVSARHLSSFPTAPTPPCCSSAWLAGVAAGAPGG